MKLWANPFLDLLTREGSRRTLVSGLSLALAWSLASGALSADAADHVARMDDAGEMAEAKSIDSGTDLPSRAPAQAAAVGECVADARTMAEAFLNAWADGSASRAARRDCWAPGRHPFVVYSGSSETLNGQAVQSMRVDEHQTFEGLKVDRESASSDASGPFIARFRWRTTTRGVVRRTPDSMRFYLDPSRAVTGSCMYSPDPPTTAALRASCDSSVRQAH